MRRSAARHAPWRPCLRDAKLSAGWRDVPDDEKPNDFEWGFAAEERCAPQSLPPPSCLRTTDTRAEHPSLFGQSLHSHQ